MIYVNSAEAQIHGCEFMAQFWALLFAYAAVPQFRKFIAHRHPAKLFRPRSCPHTSSSAGWYTVTTMLDIPCVNWASTLV